MSIDLLYEADRVRRCSEDDPDALCDVYGHDFDRRVKVRNRWGDERDVTGPPPKKPYYFLDACGRCGRTRYGAQDDDESPVMRFDRDSGEWVEA